MKSNFEAQSILNDPATFLVRQKTTTFCFESSKSHSVPTAGKVALQKSASIAQPVVKDLRNARGRFFAHASGNI